MITCMRLPRVEKTKGQNKIWKRRVFRVRVMASKTNTSLMTTEPSNHSAGMAWWGMRKVTNSSRARAIDIGSVPLKVR
jgi:NADH:ubiquinone oxidoreductase subunit D